VALIMKVLVVKGIDLQDPDKRPSHPHRKWGARSKACGGNLGVRV